MTDVADDNRPGLGPGTMVRPCGVGATRRTMARDSAGRPQAGSHASAPRVINEERETHRNGTDDGAPIMSERDRYGLHSPTIRICA